MESFDRRSRIRGPRAGGRVLLLRALLAGVGAIAALPAGATILLFDQARDSTGVVPTPSGGSLPGDYGDGVNGAVMAVPGGFFTYGDGGEGFTPDVTIDIFTSNASELDPGARLWPGDYGDLVNVVFGEGPGIGGSPFLNVRLKAAPGFVVDLYGFELAGWNNADYTIAGVSVLAGDTPLFSQSNVLVEGNLTGPRHTTFDFGTPISGSELLLRLDLSNLAESLQDNVGIDSIRFGQTPPPVPEPDTGLLVLLGLVGTAACRKRGRPREASG